MFQANVKKINSCTNVYDYSRKDGGKTRAFDSTLGHVNSDCENNVQNDVNAKCLRPQEIVKQTKRFASLAMFLSKKGGDVVFVNNHTVKISSI